MHSHGSRYQFKITQCYSTTTPLSFLFFLSPASNYVISVFEVASVAIGKSRKLPKAETRRLPHPHVNFCFLAGVEQTPDRGRQRRLVAVFKGRELELAWCSPPRLLPLDADSIAKPASSSNLVSLLFHLTTNPSISLLSHLWAFERI